MVGLGGNAHAYYASALGGSFVGYTYTRDERPREAGGSSESI
jgi:hypothetical protein